MRALLPVERVAPGGLPDVLQVELPALLPDALQTAVRALLPVRDGLAAGELPALLREPDELQAELPDVLQVPDGQEPDRKPCAHTLEPEPEPCVRR